MPFPREIWTENIELSQSEFRLLGWFCSNLRFGVQQFEFTDDNILSGVQKDGKSYPPVGLSRNSMQRARDLLMDKKLLLGGQVSGGGRGKAAVWAYSLNLSDVEKNDVETSQPLINNLSTPESFNLVNLSKFDNVIRKERTTERAENTSLPSWIPKEQWEAYVSMRKQIRKPLTDYAIKLAINKLDTLRQEGHTPKDVLEHCIMNSYQGIFPPSKGLNGNGHKPSENGNGSSPDILTRLREQGKPVDRSKEL